jgi:C1A family cysteine protease
MSIVVTPLGHRLGYKRPNRFHRMLSSCVAPSGITIPDEVDLRMYFSGIQNQGNEGACTAFGTCEVFEGIYSSITGRPIPVRRSRDFAYAVTRLAEHTFPLDQGATMADEFSVGAADGFCSEDVWPYGHPSEQPSAVAYADALKWKFADPVCVPLDATSMKQVLAQKRPLGFSMGVTQNFENVGADGRVPYPDSSNVLGGHGMSIWGFNSYGWIVPNSWGPLWGDKGFCYLQFGWEKDFWELYSDVSPADRFSFPS